MFSACLRKVSQADSGRNRTHDLLITRQVVHACLVIRRSWVRFLPESTCDFFSTVAQTCTEHYGVHLCWDKAKLSNIIIFNEAVLISNLNSTMGL